MIEIKNITKIYGKKKVVDNLSLKINNGDIFAFVGHNGAGKTTTIKAMMGIISFDKGDVIINGKSIKENPVECKKEMAYIPDNPDLYEHLTGFEYLIFIANVYDVNEEKRDELISKYANTFELYNDLGNLISSYSHGMKQKLALISALIHEPKVLVLDEPFVGLDPIASHNLKEIMKELTKEKVTIFFSTHVLEVAEKLCNKVAIIKEGKLIKTGLMKDVVKDKNLEDIFMELENE